MTNPQDLLLPFGFFALAGLVWVYRTFRLLATLKHTPVIRPEAGPVSPAPKISVIIPAKNEEKNIRACIESLQRQDYPDFELVVINDNSTDRTGEILKSLNVPPLGAPPTPPGWTGKNAAIQAGLSKARGEWFLFTDADTRHEPRCLSAVMRHVQSRGLDFLSLLPRCLTGSFWEDMIQPAAMAFLGLWFPMDRVNDPSKPVYFANGQFLLIRRPLYEKLGGHAAVRGEYLEDFALMTKSKQSGARTECAFGLEVYGTRMYDSFGGIWRGWRRIYLHAFRSNPLVLLLRAASVFLFSCLPYLLLAALAFRGSAPGVLVFGALVLVYIQIICWRGYGVVRARRVFSLLHPAAGFCTVLFLLDGALIAARGGKTVWR